MGWYRIVFSGLLFAALAGAQTLNCEFQSYKALDGLKAEMRSGSLELTWQGERGQTLRAILGVDGGQPVVRELAVEKNGKWSVLGHNLTPEYQVATGRRRISAQQEAPLRQLGIYTPDVIERQKWFAFWDAPLNIPRRPGGYRWRAPGSQFPGRHAGPLHGRLALHGLPRHQPASPGGDCQDRRALGGLQVRGRPEGFQHRRR